MRIQIGNEDFGNLWATLRFFPTRWERALALFWPITTLFVFSPLFVVPLFASGSLTNYWSFVKGVIGIGFVSSLLVACNLGGASVALWERTFRDTFGGALEDGPIKETQEGIEEYLRLSRQLEVLMRSRWRYAMWLALVSMRLVTQHRIWDHRPAFPSRWNTSVARGLMQPSPSLTTKPRESDGFGAFSFPKDRPAGGCKRLVRHRCCLAKSKDKASCLNGRSLLDRAIRKQKSL